MIRGVVETMKVEKTLNCFKYYNDKRNNDSKESNKYLNSRIPKKVINI